MPPVSFKVSAKKYTPSALTSARLRASAAKAKASATRRASAMRALNAAAAAVASAGRVPARKATVKAKSLFRATRNKNKKNKWAPKGADMLARIRVGLQRMVERVTHRKKQAAARIRIDAEKAAAAQAQAQAAAMQHAAAAEAAAKAGNAAAASRKKDEAMEDIEMEMRAAVARVEAARDMKVADIDMEGAKEDADELAKQAQKTVSMTVRRGRSSGKAPSLANSAAALEEARKRGAEISKQKRLAREAKKAQVIAAADAEIDRLRKEAAARKAQLIAGAAAWASSLASRPQLSASAARAFMKK